ncbi:hypothetical protein SAMN05421806_106208 [Streptomyces indicus]|uniref:Uncharacterized protein n=2 Tax=Streptomyces indicus TaxID=417292 RepID=A0A1G9AX93_9ACTN|nr:hypothetical protein SAMN05421806_106208 [Streptomyces indicus]
MRYAVAAAAGFFFGTSALRLLCGRGSAPAGGPAAPACHHPALDEELRHREARAHQQRMHWELLSKAIDDPALAEVIDTYRVELSPEKRRQMMYANLWYVNALHLHMSGLLTKRELFGHLRDLFQSPYICEYWEMTRHHRLALDPESEEAEIGRMAEELYQELQDGDGDWFVVGAPPD